MDFLMMAAEQAPATDFMVVVTRTVTKMTREKASIDQAKIRQCLGLIPSYLIADMTTGENGIHSWRDGVNRLIDILAALHARRELELETLNQASKACSECWSIASTWRGFDDSREIVRTVATRLKRLLDENGRTYRGQPIWTPRDD